MHKDLSSKLIYVSRQKESVMEAMEDDSTSEVRYMRESLIWIDEDRGP